MRRVSVRAVVIALTVAFVATLAAERPAAADPFDGKIVTSKKRIPTSAKSKGAYFAKLRKMNTDKFWENKEKKQWKIHFAAFFKRPLNDLEVTIKLYDITEGKQLKASFEQFLDQRGQKSVISNIKLDRERFGVNRRMMMVVENRGRVLAATRFRILGEAERFSGKVDFTEDE